MAWDSGLFIFQLVPNHIGVIIASPLNKIKYLPETGPYPAEREIAPAPSFEFFIGGREIGNVPAPVLT
ncbi:hypothetical protein, partial [Klebsiella pneumoniae]|uniref:hypothetical protein n=1 Tax=Klebsiella pneumoniae TaxID=573 RepID=UPI00210B3055